MFLDNFVISYRWLIHVYMTNNFYRELAMLHPQKVQKRKTNDLKTVTILNRPQVKHAMVNNTKSCMPTGQFATDLRSWRIQYYVTAPELSQSNPGNDPIQLIVIVLITLIFK